MKKCSDYERRVYAKFCGLPHRHREKAGVSVPEHPSRFFTPRGEKPWPPGPRPDDHADGQSEPLAILKILSKNISAGKFIALIRILSD